MPGIVNRSMKSGRSGHSGQSACRRTWRGGSNGPARGLQPERGQPSCKARGGEASPTLTRQIPGNAGLTRSTRYAVAGCGTQHERGRRTRPAFRRRRDAHPARRRGRHEPRRARRHHGDHLPARRRSAGGADGRRADRNGGAGAGRQRAHRRRRQPVRQDDAEEHRDRLGLGVPRAAGTQLLRAAPGHVHRRRSRPPAAPTRRRSGPSTVRPTSASTSTSPSTTSSIAVSARPATSPRPT